MTLIEQRQSSREFAFAYDVLAPSYDAFTGAGDYAAWVSGLLAEARGHGLRSGTAYEVGCGTGRTTVALVDAGFRVTACDPSQPMLDRARDRLGRAAELQRGGLPALPPAPPADVVVALNDVLNYVPHDALAPAVGALAERTVPGGLVLFDVNTAWTYEHGFFATSIMRETADQVFITVPVPTETPGVHDSDLHIFTASAHDPELWDHDVSSHRHWHHSHAAVVDALEAAGLTLLRAFGQHDDGRRDLHFDEETHPKRVYLARRR